MNKNIKNQILLMRDFCQYLGLNESIIEEILEGLSEEEIFNLNINNCIESVIQEINSNIEYYFNSGRVNFINLKQELLKLELGERLDLNYINGEYDSFIKVEKDIYDIRSNGECITFANLEDCIKFYNGEKIKY